MEQKQWQCLMMQCLGMLVLCLGLCAVFSGGWNKESNMTLVRAEVHPFAEAERKDIVEATGPAVQPEVVMQEELSQDKILVLDAGHGGNDEGAWDQSGNPVEKKFNLMIVKMLKERFDQTPGVQVHYTRLTDTEVSKKKRVAIANKLQADAFVSIHCNASDPGDTASRGVETLYSKRKTGKSQISNQALAQQIVDSLSAATGLKNRGTIRREGLYLMHHSKVPTTIVEIGYISNKSDLKYLNSKKGREKIVDGIYNGIMTSLEGETK
ncbi:MAG: N-acetylmuramoyl-L-alanine amidase [Lachnospiraceae bacterium]|nr:N-acetylmuramoyl-L-alanine amidase [Lachnospiraceae bacterium]